MVPSTTPDRDRTARIPSSSAMVGVVLALVVTTSVLATVAVPAGAAGAGASLDVAHDADGAGLSTGSATVATAADGSAGGASTVEARAGGSAGGASAADVAGSRCPASPGEKACITGQFTYKDGDGNLHPARQVKVELVDDDVINHEIRTTRTDDRGRFVFVFDPDEHAFWGSETTVFLNFYAENPAADGTKTELRLTYEAESDSMDVSPGDTIRMGRFYPSEHNDVWRAIDWTLTARREIAAKTGGWAREQVRIKYPATFAERAQTISVPGFRQITLPERSEYGWDRSTVYHEYGHAVMDAMYDYNPLDWPLEAVEDMTGCHVPDSETNPSFAWIEGWAEFTEAAVADDPNADGMVLESGNYYDRTDGNGDCPPADAGGEFDGASVEGSVASVLWDVYDGRNDDGLDYTLGDVVRTIDAHDVQDVHDFWNHFVTDGNRADLREIYYDHGILKADRYEGVESASNPHALSANATVSAQVNRGDDDHFAVDLEDGETLTATLDYDAADGDLDLAVYGPDGDRVGFDGSGSDDATVAVTADAAGTYEVVAAGDGGTSAPYDLTVETEPADDYAWLDPGLLPGVVIDAEYLDWVLDDGVWRSSVDVTNVSLDDPTGNLSCDAGALRIRGSLSNAGDGDAHTVAVPDGCAVSVDVSGPEGADYDLYVTLDGRVPTAGDYDRRSRSPGPVESVELGGDRTADTAEVGVLVTAYRGSGDYTITIRPVEED